MGGAEHKPGSTANLRESEHNAPHLTLVPQAIFADYLQFRIPGDPTSAGCLRLQQRQAHAQWPGSTDRRADSKAVALVNVGCLGVLSSVDYLRLRGTL